ncbi:asparagine--tRNA ligase [Buchnera aphidicola]|uniref:asparagine--tRNA ligase n=1 Tax=Buchnera aphidicola TaxID=9 RepID=UPI0030EBBBBA
MNFNPKHYSISEIFKNQKKFLKSLVIIKGWVKNKRSSKIGISFIDINDGSCLSSIQIIAKKKLKNYFSEILKLTTGCSVSIKGFVIISLKNNNICEIEAYKIKVLGWVKNSSSYPMSPKIHTMEHLREFSHLRIRTKIIHSVSKIRHIIFQSFHKFLWKKEYYWVPSPIITELNAEGAGDMFRVSRLNISDITKKNFSYNNFYKKDFFGKETFLTVSGQLTLETYACALSKVYTLGPTFRAENSNTNRHLSEFWMLEVEAAFLTLNDIIKLILKMLKYVIFQVLKKCHEEIFFLKNNIDAKIDSRLKKFLSSKFVIINYAEALKILKISKNKEINSICYGQDLNSDQEKYLTDIYFKSPIVIKNYPKEIKAFYMRLNEDKKTVSGADFIFPKVGEIIGGSQREERSLILKKRIQQLGLDPKFYKWYQDLRNYGTVPHSGFGLGLERFILYITGLKNIKDVTPFPRVPKNANF